MTDFSRWGLTPFGPAPKDRHMEWYRRGKTAFIHFTVNTFTDREWGDGTEDPSVFAPTQLDCRQWMKNGPISTLSQRIMRQSMMY